MTSNNAVRMVENSFIIIILLYKRKFSLNIFAHPNDLDVGA